MNNLKTRFLQSDFVRIRITNLMEFLKFFRNLLIKPGKSDTVFQVKKNVSVKIDNGYTELVIFSFVYYNSKGKVPSLRNVHI